MATIRTFVTSIQPRIDNDGTRHTGILICYPNDGPINVTEIEAILLENVKGAVPRLTIRFKTDGFPNTLTLGIEEKNCEIV